MPPPVAPEVAKLATSIVKLSLSITVLISNSAFSSVSGIPPTGPTTPEKVTKSPAPAPCPRIFTVMILEALVVEKQLSVSGEENVARIGVMSTKFSPVSI